MTPSLPHSQKSGKKADIAHNPQDEKEKERERERETTMTHAAMTNSTPAPNVCETALLIASSLPGQVTRRLISPHPPTHTRTHIQRDSRLQHDGG